MNFILTSFRVYHNLTEGDIAKELSVSLLEYKSLEAGIGVVNSEMAMNLSTFYQAPPEVFLLNHPTGQFSFIYSHCYFNNGNGYVNNLNNEFDSQEIILLLKDELKTLRELTKTLSNKVIVK